jgi:hypothetical protein
MALTAERAGRLERVGLVKFFTDNKALYKGLAEEAYAYAAKAVAPTQEPVRVDDVAPALQLALTINKPLVDFLDSHRLTQKYWTVWFGDFVLDKLWKDLQP